MKLSTYQTLAGKTAIYPRHLETIYPALGLAGEAGEVAGKVKKIFRDDGGSLTISRAAELRKEIGDTLWYIAALANDLGMCLDEIAQENIDKLSDRKERGTLKGDGDNR